MKTLAYNSFLVILFFLISGLSFGQKSNFIPGYVVMIDMDTLHGVLKKLRPDVANGRAVFRNTYGVKTNYYPKNVHCYKIGDEIYISKNLQRNSSVIGGPKGFMQVMDTGEVNLYFYHYEVNSEKSYQTYFNPAEAGCFFSLQDIDSADVYKPSAYNEEYFVTQALTGDFYVERKGRLHQRIKTSGFKKQMMAFFEDDPSLVEELKNKSLKYGDVIFMVQVYNRKKVESRK
jgi:hypothetical protein